METPLRSMQLCRLTAVVLALTGGATVLTPVLKAQELSILVPRVEGWLVTSFREIDVPPLPKNRQNEVAALKSITAKRTAEDIARFRWWAAGGPVHRWNEIILDELQENFVTLPLAARHLALFHAALDDAIAVARYHRKSPARPEAVGVDAAVYALGRQPLSAVSPSEYAAAAAAAAEVLGYLFPARATHFAARAEESMQTRLLAGAELPHEVSFGRVIGQQIGALAVARGKSDRSDIKWSASVPQGPGLWKGSNPIAPLAGTWRPWVLSSQSEFRPPAPPSFESDQVKTALAELKNFTRTPKSNHRAIFWEVHGGARAHTLWNEIARVKLLENGDTGAAASRVLAALNIAFADAGIACWDAKYAFWFIRPSQLDSELNPLFPPPNHPSYPAAHGCFSTAAATVLAQVFPHDRDRLLALGKEAGDARIWAGIHYGFDVIAGEQIGRKVAEKALERAFVFKAQ